MGEGAPADLGSLSVTARRSQCPASGALGKAEGGPPPPARRLPDRLVFVVAARALPELSGNREQEEAAASTQAAFRGAAVPPPPPGAGARWDEAAPGRAGGRPRGERGAESPLQAARDERRAQDPREPVTAPVGGFLKVRDGENTRGKPIPFAALATGARARFAAAPSGPAARAPRRQQRLGASCAPRPAGSGGRLGASSLRGNSLGSLGPQLQSLTLETKQNKFLLMSPECARPTPGAETPAAVLLRVTPARALGRTQIRAERSPGAFQRGLPSSRDRDLLPWKEVGLEHLGTVGNGYMVHIPGKCGLRAPQPRQDPLGRRCWS